MLFSSDVNKKRFLTGTGRFCLVWETASVTYIRRFVDNCTEATSHDAITVKEYLQEEVLTMITNIRGQYIY